MMQIIFNVIIWLIIALLCWRISRMEDTIDALYDIVMDLSDKVGKVPCSNLKAPEDKAGKQDNEDNN